MTLHQPIPRLHAITVRLVGLLTLFTIPLRHIPRHVEQVLFFNPAVTSHYISFGLGLFLLYLSQQIGLRKRSAYILVVLILAVLLFFELLHFRAPIHLLIYGVTLASLLLGRHEYVVKTDGESIWRATKIAGMLTVVTILFAVAVFAVLDQRYFGRHISTAETARITARTLLEENSESPIRLSRNDRVLIDLIRLSFVMAGVIVVAAVFQPLKLRTSAAGRHIRRADELIHAYPESSEDFFKIWPEDKHYFFYGDSFVAYKVGSGVAFVLDGPNGSPHYKNMVRQEFLTYAGLNGWSVSVVHANAAEKDAWAALGLHHVFIGSEAYIQIDSFLSQTISDKHFRYVRNKAQKSGLTFELWDPPLSSAQIAQLRYVSDQWIKNGRKEYGFFMGIFEESYLASCRVGTVSRDKTVIAYTNLLPIIQPSVLSVDHMRVLPQTESITTHFMFMELIKRLEGHGASFLNLGLVPLSKLEALDSKTVAERLLLVLKRLGNRYYSFKGLEQFKGKFDPSWEPRFLLYQGGLSKLPAIASGLNKVTAIKVQHQGKGSRRILLLSVVAGLCYASFPLAILLNPPFAWSGLVSMLGALGQPYNWLFSVLDIVSSMIMLGIIGYIYVHTRRQGAIRPVVYMVALAALGAFFAAIWPLPENFHITLRAALNVHVLIHGIASFVNSAGFVISGIWWARTYDRRVLWRHAVMFAALILSTVGFVVGDIIPSYGAFIQRGFIVCYGIWAAGILFDLSKDVKRHSHKRTN